MKRCVAGLVMFLTASVLGCAVSRSGLNLILLGGYSVFILFTYLQKRLTADFTSARETVFLYNLMLFVKTALIFCMFLLPGTFGNIHSVKVAEKVQPFILFACIIFLIINFFYEKILLNKIIFAEKERIPFCGVPVRPSAVTAYFPLVYFASAFVYVIFHVLYFGYIGPFWFLLGIAVYSLAGTVGFTVFLGENKIVNDIIFVAVTAVKYAIPLILFGIFFPDDNPGLRPAPLAEAYLVSGYICLAVLCIQIAADTAVIICIFLKHILGRLRRG